MALGVGKADTVQLNTAGCPGLTFSLVNSTIRGLVTAKDRRGRLSGLQYVRELCNWILTPYRSQVTGFNALSAAQGYRRRFKHKEQQQEGGEKEEEEENEHRVTSDDSETENNKKKEEKKKKRRMSTGLPQTIHIQRTTRRRRRKRRRK